MNENILSEQTPTIARLILEDGTVMVGNSIGAKGQTFGEVVFNTGMTGYQEVLSDPSYYGQLITMTYPLIGNYGITREDYEAIKPFAQGFIVREMAPYASNWRNQMSLHECLLSNSIVGIEGIDTRMLTRKIRTMGTMKGIITTETTDETTLIELLKQPLPRDHVHHVSTKSSYGCPGTKERVVVIDYGAKHGILRELSKRQCDVVVVPYDTSAEDILKLHPDGVVLSNGPGDPKDVPKSIETVRQLLGQVPIFGICLGHQLIALACGGDTQKLKFGHRGGNHPVRDEHLGRVFLTSQNHGHAVTAESLEGTELDISHWAINDGTVEGLKHRSLPAFSVQYHPEGAPGPEDSTYLFDDFITMMNNIKKGVLTNA